MYQQFASNVLHWHGLPIQDRYQMSVDLPQISYRLSPRTTIMECLVPSSASMFSLICKPFLGITCSNKYKLENYFLRNLEVFKP